MVIISFLSKFNISRAKFVIFFPMLYFSGTLCVPAKNKKWKIVSSWLEENFNNASKYLTNNFY